MRKNGSCISKAGIIAAIGITTGWSTSHGAMAQEPSHTMMQQSESTSLTATVEKIDKPHRMVTLRGPDGKAVVVTAGDEVRNFDQIKVGDHVNVTYSESVAVAVGKPGEAMPKTQVTERTERGGPGGMPRGARARQTTMTGKVISVSPEKNQVVVQGPQGNLRTIQVKDPEMQTRLSTLKPGSTIQVTYTEAIALSISPAP